MKKTKIRIHIKSVNEPLDGILKAVVHTDYSWAIYWNTKETHIFGVSNQKHEN